ncbi:hypothetical protein FOC4_g10004370 [Fusarium odoratissimum]|uniref:Uncharacterized protein n=1 Tax=Fusarium oxysporum f. sp. cubense (strain race 4) TaxID=2502994 RepID=N1SB50_FUSC4|nr:hypothetical protein FOC4_g10004370 [Fusarium odoratissimum]
MTFATRRSLRRSQTIDHDELADTKIGFIEMLPSTQPKRRGRPPKSSTLCGKLPGSKPRGRPRSTAPRIMSDKRIALTLGWRMRKFTMGKRVGDAARSVYRLSRQWPWDLVAGFVPKKWGVEILESLRRLFRIIHQNFTVHDHRNDFQFVKDYLRECAMKHSRRRPHLKNSDIRDACDYFADDNPARRNVIRTKMTRLKCSISTVVPEDEDGWQDYRGYDYFDDDDDDEHVDIATPTKGSRTPSSPSLSPKRARTAELSSDVKAYESERKKILKIRRFVEQQHKGMMMKADHLLQQYTSRLEEYDKLIAQANVDVSEDLDQVARRDFDLEDEKKRLEGRVKEVLEEVRHCSVIGTLMRLGPGGMAKLLGRLEGNGVELVGMAESIMNETEE